MKTVRFSTLALSLAILSAAGAARAKDGSGIAWIEDDYQAALKQAREQGKPLFVDVWATWCHACLSMKRFVFVDPGLREAAKAAVFLSIEQEQPRNRPFFDKFPVNGLPTFLLLDPKDESILGRWLGSGSVADMRAFVRTGAAEVQARREGKAEQDTALHFARLGDQAELREDHKAAVEAYDKAVQRTDKADPFRSSRLVALATASAKVGTPEVIRRCLALTLGEMSAAANTSVGGDMAYGSLMCAEKLPKGDPEAARVQALALPRLQAVVDDASAPLSADDRSDILSSVVEVLDDQGKHAEAVKAAEKRRDLLLAAQKAASDPEVASTFDPHLTDTYLYLKDLGAAEKLLSAREKEMPTDYNPPARLARVLFEEKRFADAEQAIDRALKLQPEGPRRVQVLSLKAKILKSEGKPTRAVLQEQLRIIESLPASKRNPKAEQKIRAELQAQPS
jgi:tetratricopeptide (TPR) repeat protein